MDAVLLCWRCGKGLEKLSLPLARLDECPHCGIQVHVCRMCIYFDLAVARSCLEDGADDVKEKDRPNFCDFFRPRTDAFDSEFTAADRKAGGELEQLFGGSNADDAPSDTAGQAADDLFK
jgi:hypothetical protein